MTPPDACPFRRPFPAGFDECPAYQPIRQHPLDSRHRPLAPIWACAHLEVGRTEPARHYPRCRIGDLQSRRDWAARLRTDRVSRWRELAQVIGSGLEGRVAAIYDAKAREVGATEEIARAAAGKELRERIDAFLVEHRRLMEARSDESSAIGFPVEPVLLLTREAMAELAGRRTLLGSWVPPDALLEPFEPELRLFLRGLFSATGAGG